jgi:integrase/recombinase XerD
MEIRGGDLDDYLFPTVYNEIMAMSSLQDSVKKYCNERGVYKTSLHLFRHTFITNAVNQNVNPLLLQRIKGHSTMQQLN